jgi:hypothetical protein
MPELQLLYRQFVFDDRGFHLSYLSMSLRGAEETIVSQQEFAPGPQSQQPESEDEVYQPHYPYSWSGNTDSKAAPRDEPPSTYEYSPDAMIQGYQAQDAAGQQPQAGANPYEYQLPAQEQTPPEYQYNPYSNDAKTYEQGYNPYNNAQVTPGPGFNPYTSSAQNNWGQTAPSWARPQRQRPGGFRFGWIILVLIFISMSSGAMRFFFFDFGNSIGFIFLPIILLMIVASIISRALWGGNRRGGGRRGGPWGW